MSCFKPLIGITSSMNDEETRISVNRHFQDALLTAGAIPVLLPFSADPETQAAMAERCDGFLFSGGDDIDPRCYGEHTRPCCGSITPERDAFELPFAALLHARHDKPVLGVCRGAQALTVALGGTVFQDIPTDYGKPVIQHRQKQLGRYASHSIEIKEGSLLHRIMQDTTINVNSFHHQAANKLPEALMKTAQAPDGIIEAVESNTHPFFLGVQWHPEIMWRTDEKSASLFQALVNACRSLKQ